MSSGTNVERATLLLRSGTINVGIDVALNLDPLFAPSPASVRLVRNSEPQ